MRIMYMTFTKLSSIILSFGWQIAIIKCHPKNEDAVDYLDKPNGDDVIHYFTL